MSPPIICLKPGAGGRVCPRRRGRTLQERRAASQGGAPVPSSSGPQPQAAAGPVGSEGRPSARRGPGLEIQGPQCAFETSMFMCPAVHMSTRNLLRSSSTHEPSDPPFRVVSSFVAAVWQQHHHRTGPIPFFDVAGRRATTRGVTAGTLPVTRGESRHRSRCRDRLQTSVTSFELRGRSRRAGCSGGNQPSWNTRWPAQLPVA